MVTYLYMDGIDDTITANGFPYNIIEIDMLIETPSSSDKAIWCGDRGLTILAKSNGTIALSNSSMGQITQNGTLGVRSTIKFTASSPQVSSRFFYSMSGQYCEGNIYSIKMFFNTSLIAHYDMSTGSVQNQAADGYDGVLSGGTWKEEGTSPPADEGTSIIKSYSIKQTINKVNTNNYFVRQQVRKITSRDSLTSQSLYKQTENEKEINISINNTLSKNYSIEQLINKQIVNNILLKQAINNQKLMNIEIEQIISKQAQIQASTKQTIYEQVVNEYNTFQNLYKNSIQRIDNYFVKIEMFKETITNHSFNQQITNISDAYINLRQVIKDSQILSIDIKQILSKAISEDISIIQELYSNKALEYDTIQSLQADFKLYKQIIKNDVMLKRIVVSDILLTNTIKTETKITRSIKSDVLI
jgi:hypothetical protein